jgi:hypothetical protein
MGSTFATPSASPAATASASPAPSGIIALLGGDAIAFGTNTLAAGEVTNKVENVGGTTIASGEAVFLAEGTSPLAKTGVAVTGEDLLFEVTINEHGGKGSTAWDESATRYVAIDIPGWNLPGGPIVVDQVINLPSMPGMAGPGELLGIDRLGSSGLPSANFAHDTVMSEAPLVIDLSDALAVGGHLSAVAALSLVAA